MVTAFLPVYLPLMHSDCVVFANLSCFAVYIAAISYAFAACSALLAWKARWVLPLMALLPASGMVLALA
ncbi:hypothetical protein [Pseudomonas boanensis]|uniref:hypothetical protein n=1 Tax=Metapseudomonas boanensis TaxID=2822138 RepID=UPI0035D48531